MACKECYSENPRITPLLEPENCLTHHTQYRCATCGRCICIDHDEKRDVYRWKFPFKTLEIAKLYLRTAETCCGDVSGIYGITGKNNRVSYKIFHTENDLSDYLAKNKEKSCREMKPVYISEKYVESPNAEIRKLTPEEAAVYLEEQRQYNK